MKKSLDGKVPSKILKYVILPVLIGCLSQAFGQLAGRVLDTTIFDDDKSQTVNTCDEKLKVNKD